MAETLETGNRIVPADLAVSTQPDIDKDFFSVSIKDLKLDKTYAIQFQWVYEDGKTSEWSTGYQVVTATEGVPGAVSATVPSTSTGNIPVTLSVFPANARRVDIYVIGGIYGAGKVVDSFLSAGTKTISVSDPGVYQVSLIAVTPSGINGDPTNTFTITVSGSTVDTTVIPGAPSAVLVTGFNDTSDPLNRTGYANISWTAGSGAKGYWVGLWTSTPGSSAPIRQVETNDTSVRVDGLAVGSSYYFQVKSYNTFNNPSVYVAPALNYPVLIPGNTTVPGAVTVSGSGTPRSIVVSWTEPATAASLVTAGGYYIAKLYTNAVGSGSPLQTKTCFSNSTTFAGLTTGTSYWVTVQPYTAGSSPVAGTLSSVYGPLIATSVEPADIQADFILANNQFQVGNSGTLSDVHLSAYPKTVGGVPVKGRIYIGASETSISDPTGLYNSSGTPFYADDTGRFSLGDKLTWSGGALNVKGTIDVTGASTFSSYVIAGATTSTFIGIGYQVPYRLASVLQTGASALNGIVLNSSGSVANSDWIKADGTFRLANGNLTFTGGTLSVVGSITANALSANATIDSPLITGGTYRTSATVGNGSTAGIKVDTSGIYGYTAASATPNFSVSNTGILTALGGTIGGWDINGTQLRSTGTNSITLNPNTPKIALLQSGVEKITIDPVEGIKDSAGNFTLTPAGNLTLKGSMTSGSTITGANITMTGTVNGYGTATAKLLFQDSNYAVSAGSSTTVYPGSSGYYDSEGDWISATSSQTITNNDIRFTDATLGGAIPGAGFYYGELWLGSGSGSGSTDLWANYPGGYIGVSIVADSTQKNIMIFGDSSAGFTTLHRSSTTDSSKESPAFLQVDSSGRMSRGRAIITGGSSAPSTTLGLTGDLYFSTAT